MGVEYGKRVNRNAGRGDSIRAESEREKRSVGFLRVADP